MTRRSRWLGVALVIVSLLVVVSAWGFGRPILALLTAYEAKMLCSEVFVAGRAPEDVLAELATEDLSVLRLLSAQIDRASRTVTVRAPLNAMTREARFRDSGGCAVAFERHPSPTSDPPPAEVKTSAVEFEASQTYGAKTQLAAALDDAFSEPDPERPRRTRAAVIVANGRIVAERYAAGFTADTPMLGWSMTKSALNALVGILVGQGRMSLDVPAPFPEWQSANDARRGITLSHLLRMSSGLRFDEQMSTPVTDVTTMLFEAPDMGAFAVNKPLDASPGARWQYSSGTSLIISRWIRQVVGADFARFPKTALFDRLGMSSAVIETDATGTIAGSSFMYATARDWARLGQLYLQDGIWNGVRILPEGWVTYTRTPAPASPTRSYGAHFWLRIPPEYGSEERQIPADAFHAAGHEGQFVTIVPSRGVVIVRLGKTRDPISWDHGRFVERVLAALSR